MKGPAYRSLAVLSLAATVVFLVLGAGAARSDNPAPPGWDPALWNSLSVDEQAIELEQSPDPSFTSAEKLRLLEEHAWSSEEAEIVQEMDAAETEEILGITGEVSLPIGEREIRVWNAWNGYNADRSIRYQVLAGTSHDDLSEGMIRLQAWGDAAGATPPPAQDFRLAGAGDVAISDAVGNVLTLATQNAGGLVLDVETRSLDHVPDCSSVVPSSSMLWPPDHQYRVITLTGATDQDGDSLTYSVTGVTQDEPVTGLDPLDRSPDAELLAGPQVKLRAEVTLPGDGRVYRVAFTVADGKNGSCTGSVSIGVPVLLSPPGPVAVDSAPPSYNSLG